jgi:hypothetical protein
MATSEKRTTSTQQAERSVTRTYRAAIRLGEDFITLEETVTLPIDASDEEVAQAVELGWRIYRAQRSTLEAQVTSVRESAPASPAITVKDPDAPASEKQRNYIAALQEDLSWTADQISGYAQEQQIDLVTMTKGQASIFIDGLKKLSEERGEYDRAPRGDQNGTPASRANDGSAVNDKQLHALERLAQQQGIDLDMETRRRFGVASHGLTTAQASGLLRDLQRRA